MAFAVSGEWCRHAVRVHDVKRGVGEGQRLRVGHLELGRQALQVEALAGKRDALLGEVDARRHGARANPVDEVGASTDAHLQQPLAPRSLEACEAGDVGLQRVALGLQLAEKPQAVVLGEIAGAAGDRVPVIVDGALQRVLGDTRGLHRGLDSYNSLRPLGSPCHRSLRRFCRFGTHGLSAPLRS
jgi:hypothetical protein